MRAKILIKNQSGKGLAVIMVRGPFRMRASYSLPGHPAPSASGQKATFIAGPRSGKRPPRFSENLPFSHAERPEDFIIQR